MHRGTSKSTWLVTVVNVKNMNMNLGNKVGEYAFKVDITPLTKFGPDTPYGLKTLHAKYFQNRNSGFPMI